MKRVLFFVQSTVLYCALTAQVPTSSLIAYYPFSGNANDMSGNGLNSTYVSAALTADRFGNTACAYSFNGIANYIMLPTSLTNLNDYTYSVWIKPFGSQN